MSETNIGALLSKGDFLCPCGKLHAAKVSRAIIESGAMKKIPEIVRGYGAKKVFVLADANTFDAAGKDVTGILSEAKIEYKQYVMGSERIEPTEHAVGSVIMHYDSSCDMIISVGAGVINDIGKILAGVAHLPYMVVGTAPSMDGYASATSSVIRDDLKVSVDSKCPDVVIGDLDVLCKAPIKMIQSGIGDMIAKYISICEWRISRIINGEYYCDTVASMIETALKKVVDNAAGIVTGDKTAVGAVMEGMVLSGIAANYAGVSRPVSGMEHYFSHVWDMRAVEFGVPFDFHGIQCGIGTINSLRVYEKIKTLTPDREKALEHVKGFDYEEWKKVLVKYLGKGAGAMIENEKKEQKFNKEKHAVRLETIISKWDEIIAVINTLPSSESIYNLLRGIGAPTCVEDINVTREAEHYAFLITKDIRDKYIGSRLLWDIGELDSVANELFPL